MKPHQEMDRTEDCLVGRDPRTLSSCDLEAMGRPRINRASAIRAKCIEFCAGSPIEVRRCGAIDCALWPFKMGTDPYRAPISEERRAALEERALGLRDWVVASAQPGQPPCEARIAIECANRYGSNPEVWLVVRIEAPCQEVWIGPQIQSWFGHRVRWSLRNNAPRQADEPLGHVAPRGFGGPTIPFYTVEQYDELRELTDADYFDD